MIHRYSAIETSYECLEKHNLLYRQGLQLEQKSADLAFGTTLHSAISACLKDDDVLGKIDPVALFTLQWESAGRQDLEYGRNKWETLRDMGLEFIRKFQKMHAKKYKALHVETNLDFMVGPHKFNGTPDCVAEVDGVPSIVDWKTSGYAYPKEKLEVSEQMWLYAHAVRQVLGVEVTQVIYVVFCKTPDCRIQTISKSITPDKLNSMLTNVEKQCRLLESMSEFPKNRRACLKGDYKCPYYDMCYPKEKA